MVNEPHARLRALQRGAPLPTALDVPMRREHAVNWGDRSRLTGRKSQTLAWVSLAASRSLVVYAHATARGGDPLCRVTIEWGHGGASVVGEYAVIKRLRVPLVASMVKLSGRLVDANGGPAGAGDVADVSAFIAEGEDGTTLRNTRWVHQTGQQGLIEGPQRLMHVEGFNPGPSTFVHVFNGEIRGGAEPDMLIPAPAGRRFHARRFDSQGFPDGVAWACSSSPLVFKQQKVTVRFDAELLL